MNVLTFFCCEALWLYSLSECNGVLWNGSCHLVISWTLHTINWLLVNKTIASVFQLKSLDRVKSCSFYLQLGKLQLIRQMCSIFFSTPDWLENQCLQINGLVLSTELIMKICHRKGFPKLTFGGLALRQGEMFRSAKRKTKSSCNTPHRRGTTVSLKTYPT